MSADDELVASEDKKPSKIHGKSKGKNTIDFKWIGDGYKKAEVDGDVLAPGDHILLEPDTEDTLPYVGTIMYMFNLKVTLRDFPAFRIFILFPPRPFNSLRVYLIN